MIKTFSFDKHHEARGHIFTFFDQREMREMSFVQDKVSVSKQGVVRGFHGDLHTWKLITCLQGVVQLVVYDVDNDEVEQIRLSSMDQEQVSVLVPPRHLNAHQCLTGKCIFLYKWSEFYKGPDAQWSVNYNDATINPKWPMLTTEISERDKMAPSLKDFKETLND